MNERLMWALSALLLGVGVALGGWFVGHGFLQARAADRYVTVKGVAERPVKADLALWPIRFVATGNDLSQVQTEIEQDAQSVTAFSHGTGGSGSGDRAAKPQCHRPACGGLSVGTGGEPVYCQSDADGAITGCGSHRRCARAPS